LEKYVKKEVFLKIMKNLIYLTIEFNNRGYLNKGGYLLRWVPLLRGPLWFNGGISERAFPI